MCVCVCICVCLFVCVYVCVRTVDKILHFIHTLIIECRFILILAWDPL